MSIVVSPAFGMTPGAPVRSGLETRGLVYVGMPDSPDARQTATDAVRAAINRINTRTYRMLETYFDITFVLDTMDYKIPTDVRSTRRVELLDTSGIPRRNLDFKNPQTFRIEHQNAAVARNPRVYTLLSYPQDGLLSLESKPQQAWINTYPTGRLWYRRTVQYPAAGEIVDVPPNFYDFLEWYVKWHLATVHAPKRASVARQSWGEAEVVMKMEDNEFDDWSERN